MAKAKYKRLSTPAELRARQTKRQRLRRQRKRAALKEKK